MHPRDTDTAACVNMWTPGTSSRRLCMGSVETLARMNDGAHFLSQSVPEKRLTPWPRINFTRHSFGLIHIYFRLVLVIA